MTVLAISVALLAVLTILNLLLVVGISRRLRDAAAQPAHGHEEAMPEREPDLPLHGELVKDAGLVTPAGVRTSLHEQLTGRRTVVVVSTSCAACTGAAEQLTLAGPERLHRPLIVIQGSPRADRTREYVDLFAPLGEVVIDQMDVVAEESFGLQGYPAYVLTDDDSVVTASYRLPQLVGDELALSQH